MALIVLSPYCQDLQLKPSQERERTERKGNIMVLINRAQGGEDDGWVPVVKMMAEASPVRYHSWCKYLHERSKINGSSKVRISFLLCRYSVK